MGEWHKSVPHRKEKNPPPEMEAPSAVRESRPLSMGFGSVYGSVYGKTSADDKRMF